MNTTASLPRSALALALAFSFAGAAGAQQHDHAAQAADASPAAAMDHSGMDPSGMNHSKRETPAKKADARPKEAAADGSQADHSQMDHSKMGHAGMDDATKSATAQNADANAENAPMDHSQMEHAAMGHTAPPRPEASQQPREPIPAVTDADRAAAFPPISQHMQHAPEFNHMVVLNRLEAVDAEHGSAQAWEGQAWFGSDTDRLWLRSEGEREDGRTESANLEALYGRAISPWWDLVAGVRHDFRPGRSQSWAAFGVQGLSPYKFEVSATAYLGERGQTALNLEAEYELLLTNRLILQPLVEVEFYGKDDPRRETGAGLSGAEAGLRLRYELSRKFAPYVGVSWERAFGDTADYRRAHGERVEDTRLVAGVRLWF